MNQRFIVRPLAEDDIGDGIRWYAAQRPGLAERFLDDVERTFARIRERPLQFPAIAARVRRALLQTFPYAVYFHVRSSDNTVVVLAVLHMKRRPGVWRRHSRE